MTVYESLAIMILFGTFVVNLLKLIFDALRERKK